MKCIIKHLSNTSFRWSCLGNEQERVERPLPLAVEVVFSSIGSGIDMRAYELFFSMATESLASGKAAPISRVPWGKEGEVTLCLQMRDWMDAYQFEQSISPIIDSNDSIKTMTKAQRLRTCTLLE